MDIKRLDWDSQFLGREVYGVTVAADADVAGMVAALRERDASIAYLFVGPDDAGLHARLTDHGAVLYDEKVTYGKELKEADEGGNEGVEVYKGELTDQLLALAILAGHESRFRKDPGLRPFFEPLYKLWMINSLKGTMADAVLVYRADAGIRGMVTCKTGADGIGRIGLIATDGAWQGKGVGRRLMKAAQEFFLTRQMDKCTVVTQRTNTGACGLYERSGFTIYKMEIIYHLWFN